MEKLNELYVERPTPSEEEVSESIADSVSGNLTNVSSTYASTTGSMMGNLLQVIMIFIVLAITLAIGAQVVGVSQTAMAANPNLNATTDMSNLVSAMTPWMGILPTVMVMGIAITFLISFFGRQDVR